MMATDEQPGRAGKARSGPWYGVRDGAASDVASFIHRAFTKAMGYDDDDLQRPVIGICNTYSELNHCNQGLKDLAEAVKRGVLQAGGLPLEFPTISLGEVFVSPTSMLFRNLAAMDTEEMIRAQPLDGVVLLAACDKTTPAQLMGAASADVPAIMVTGGPMLNGRYEGQDLGACTDCRRYWTEYRAGTVTAETMGALEDNLARSAGHCMVMGTASTMASCAEALGMMLPGGAAIPAPDSRRLRLAEATGRRAVALAREGLRPSQIMTRPAFENAIRVLHAIGGSTNAVVHLPAIAGRLGIELPLDLFDALARSTPWLANLRPSGRYQMESLFEVGGIPAVMKELAPLLHGDCLTVTGGTIAENLERVPPADARTPASRERLREVIASRDAPLDPEGGLAILTRQSLPGWRRDQARRRIPPPPQAPRASRRLLVPVRPHRPHRRPGPGRHPGQRARAPEHRPRRRPRDARGRQPPDPQEAPRPGHPGHGAHLRRPHERHLLRHHRAPRRPRERRSAAPSPPCAPATRWSWTSPDRRLTLHVPADEIARRLAACTPPAFPYRRGYGRLFLEHVIQAPQGCDFDFLTGDPEEARRAALLSRDLRS